MMKRITGLVFVLVIVFAGYTQDYDVYETNEWGVQEKTGEIRKNDFVIYC